MKAKILTLVLILLFTLACSSVTVSFDGANNTPAPALPDLVVTQVYVSTVNFSGQCTDGYTVNISVLNQGQGPADNVTVVEFSTGHTAVIGRLDPGQKMDLQLPTGSPTGVYTINVDPQNLVAESDETNNITSNILATATPVMDCIHPTPTPVDVFMFTPTPSPSRLSIGVLQNALYHSPDWGDYILTNGIYYRPPLTPQESSEIYTTRFMPELLSFGDVNSDGLTDALVFLSTQNGGTGRFVELAVVLDQNGSPYNIATTSLGDRVVVETGFVQDGIISVVMIVQGPNDPLCCPSQRIVIQFRLDGDQLVKLP